MSYTPGPWKTNPETNEVYADWEDNAMIERVAQTWLEADARLIAAAPDLLEAAKNALSAFGSYLHSPPGEYEGEGSLAGRVDKSLQSLETAIAKAEGVQVLP